MPCRDKTAAAARLFTPSPLSTQVQGRKPGPTRKKTETHNKAEAGKKCMPGRRVEERVKSNEAAKGTRGSQRTSKGRAQGRGHGGHTASTTPHRDTGEGSTGGPREERHHAPRHARHRNHTHRTHPTNPGNPPSSGRAVGRGTAPDPRPPHNGGRHPPREPLSATPTASNAGPQGRTLWGRCCVPTPAPTAPGTRGSRNPGCLLQRTGGRGSDSA